MKRKIVTKSSILAAVLMAFLMAFMMIPAMADDTGEDTIPTGTAAGVAVREGRYTIAVGEVFDLRSKLYTVDENYVEVFDPNAVIHIGYNGATHEIFAIDDEAGTITGRNDGVNGVSFWLNDNRSTTRSVEIVVGDGGSSGPDGPPGPGPDDDPPSGEAIAFRDNVDYDLPLSTGQTTIRNYITVRSDIPARSLSYASSNTDVISFDPQRADGMIINGTGSTMISVSYTDAVGQVTTIEHEFNVTAGGILADGENEVTFESSISADNKAALENFLKFHARLMGIPDDVVEQGLIDSGVDISARTAYVNFDIKVLSCITEADGSVSLSMDITPQYTWVAGGHLDPSVEKYEFQINGPFEMKIPINETFFKEAPSISHVHNGQTYTYTGSIVSEMDGGEQVTYVKFTNLHGFSVFTMSTDQASADSNKGSSVPQTGDSNNMMLWMALMGLAVVGGIGAMVAARSRKKDR